MMETIQSAPLSGIKIVEFSVGITAPACARLLAHHGAEVIKVERPEGDPYRRAGSRYVNTGAEECSKALFAAANDGKRFVTLDVDTAEGAGTLIKLIGTADAFITNLPRKELERLGIDYPALSGLYPRLVYGYVSGYGEEGPMAERPWAEAACYYARGGFMVDYVEEGAAPNNRIWGAGEFNTAMALADAVMAGLFQTMISGKGVKVSTSLLQTSTWVSSLDHVLSPYGTPYEEPNHASKDGIYMFIQAVTDKQQEGLLKVLGMTKEEYNARREVLPKLRAIYSQKTFAEWVEILEPMNMPYERLRHVSELATDPQPLANGFIVNCAPENGKQTAIPMPPFSYEGAPELNGDCTQGKDTQAVLAEIC